MAGPVRIDRRLNLVLPVDTSRGVVYVHSVPISDAVFERYWLPLSSAHSAIVSMAGITSAPRVARLALRDVSLKMDVWDGPEGVERGLLGEIHRLTNVIAVLPGEEAAGWQVIPLEAAIQAKVIDDQDLRELEGAIVFFTQASQIQSSEALLRTRQFLELSLGAQITSSMPMEFISSLQTSTETDSSGETPPAPGPAPSSPAF